MKSARAIIFATFAQIVLGGCDQHATSVIRNSPESKGMTRSGPSEDFVLLPAYTLEGIEHPAVLVKIEVVRDDAWETQSVKSPLGTTEHFQSGYPNTVPQSLITLED